MAAHTEAAGAQQGAQPTAWPLGRAAAGAAAQNMFDASASGASTAWEGSVPLPGKGPSGHHHLGPRKGEIPAGPSAYQPSCPAAAPPSASSRDGSAAGIVGGASTTATGTPRVRSRSPDRGTGPRGSPFAAAGNFFAQWFGSTKGASVGPVGPRPSADAAWLEAALKASLTAFVETVETRFRSVEGGMQAASATAAHAALTADAAQQASGAATREAAAAMTAVRQHEAVMEELRQQVEALRVDVHSRSSEASGPSAAERSVARVANLGWDADETLLVQRAKEVLQRAGVVSSASSTVAPLVTRTRLGSAAEV